MYQPAPPSGYGTASTVWFTGEYMIMFGTSESVGFPLLTTSSPNQNGVIGQPTTTALIGGEDINFGGISGMRLGGGFFGDADRRFGFDFSSVYAQPTAYKKTFDANSAATGGNGVAVGAGIPVLARPFIDTTTGSLTSLVVVSPNIPGAIPGTESLSVGRAGISVRSSLWSADPSAIFNVFRSNPDRRLMLSLDTLVGYKYLQFNEEFVISSKTFLRGVTAVETFGPPGPFGVPTSNGITLVPTPVGVGGVVTRSPTTLDIADRFVTTNRFNGGNFGIRAEARYGMFTFATRAMVGIGQMHQTLRIRGVTSFQNTDTGRSGFAYAGLYANASNVGTYTNDEFAVIPDINATVGINLTKCLSMYVGYNVIYLNRAIRPGTQLNPLIDASTVPFSTTYGAAGTIPSAMKPLIQQEYWLQGASFGFAFKY